MDELLFISSAKLSADRSARNTAARNVRSPQSPVSQKHHDVKSDHALTYENTPIRWVRAPQNPQLALVALVLAVTMCLVLVAAAFGDWYANHQPAGKVYVTEFDGTVVSELEVAQNARSTPAMLKAMQ